MAARRMGTEMRSGQVKAVMLRWHLRDNEETEGMSSCGQEVSEPAAG